jgi:prepilin-type N-terminal cleavage/methylation domain-containing protein
MKQRGFSLVELLIVLAIIGLIMAMVISSVSRKDREAKALATTQQVVEPR